MGPTPIGHRTMYLAFLNYYLTEPLVYHTINCLSTL